MNIADLDQGVFLIIAFIFLVLFAISHTAKRLRRLHKKAKPKIAEHRLAAQYLLKDPDEIEDSTPHIYRARWMIVGSTIAILLWLVAAFFWG